MAELAPLTARQDTAEVDRVLSALSARSGRSAVDIAARAGISSTTVQSLLGALELDGRVREVDSGWVRA